MYLISQFSKISGLTVKALRYYDEQNILKPSYRAENTLYRYYDENDLEKALLIKLLRSLNFSILEIKETLEMAENEMDLSYILREKIEKIEQNITQEKALIEEINNYLSPATTNAKHQNYKISIEEVPPILVASVRFEDKYNELGKYVPLLYNEVQNSVSGDLVNCYYDEECVEQADMELCLPTKKKISSSKVECKYLPAIKAICTTHYGSHEMLHFAYKALFEYVNEQKIETYTPSREIYVKGPGRIFKGNPQNYVTKILLPIEIPKEN